MLFFLLLLLYNEAVGQDTLRQVSIYNNILIGESFDSAFNEDNPSFRALQQFVQNKQKSLDLINSQKEKILKVSETMQNMNLDLTKRNTELSFEINRLKNDITKLRLDSIRIETINIQRKKEGRTSTVNSNNKILDSIRVQIPFNQELIFNAVNEIKSNDSIIEYQQSNIQGLNIAIDSLHIYSNKLLIDIDKAEEAINNLDPVAKKEMADWKLTIMAISAILIFMILYFCTMRYFVNKDNSKIVSDFMLDHEGIKFVSVFVIIIVILLFGAMRILDGTALSGLLGSIAGYLLGRASEKRNGDNTSEGGNGK